MPPTDRDDTRPDPRLDAQRCVLLFNTIHDVLSAEKLFKEQGIWHDMIPTPRRFSANCGMSLEVKTAEAGAVSRLLTESSVTHQLLELE